MASEKHSSKLYHWVLFHFVVYADLLIIPIRFWLLKRMAHCVYWVQHRHSSRKSIKHLGLYFFTPSFWQLSNPDFRFSTLWAPSPLSPVCTLYYHLLQQIFDVSGVGNFSPLFFSLLLKTAFPSFQSYPEWIPRYHSDLPFPHSFKFCVFFPPNFFPVKTLLSVKPHFLPTNCLLLGSYMARKKQTTESCWLVSHHIYNISPEVKSYCISSVD